MVFFTHCRFRVAHINVAFRIVPGRDAVPPPDLAADAPVLDVAHPFKIGVLPVVRHEADGAAFHCLNGGPCQRGHLDEPLVGEQGLNHCAGAIAAWYHQLVVFGLFQQPLRCKVVDHDLAGLETVQTKVFFRCRFVDAGIDGEDIDDGQMVALAHGVVIEIVGRGDFDAAGAEGGVHILVSNDGDAPLAEWQYDLLTDQMAIAFVFRMHRYRGVAQHGFRAGGGHHQCLAAVRQGIADVPQVTAFFLGNDFQIRDCGMQYRIPVDQALAAIDQPFIIEAHENLSYCGRKSFIHGETFPRPVKRAAHTAQLAGDGVAGLLPPCPDPLNELLPAQIVAGFPLCSQLPLHYHLGGDAGMVRADLPEGVFPLHAVIARQGIHESVLKGVSHMQGAGHVGRWDHDAVGFTASLGGEITRLFPVPVPALFDVLRVVGLVHTLVFYRG